MTASMPRGPLTWSPISPIASVKVEAITQRSKDCSNAALLLGLIFDRYLSPIDRLMLQHRAARGSGVPPRLLSKRLRSCVPPGSRLARSGAHRRADLLRHVFIKPSGVFGCRSEERRQETGGVRRAGPVLKL